MKIFPPRYVRALYFFVFVFSFALTLTAKVAKTHEKGKTERKEGGGEMTVMSVQIGNPEILLPTGPFSAKFSTSTSHRVRANYLSH